MSDQPDLTKAADKAQGGRAMSDTAKVLFGLIAAAFLGFQGWLAMAAIQVGNLKATIDDNRSQREKAIESLTGEDEEIYEDIRELRGMIIDMRVRAAAERNHQ